MLSLVVLAVTVGLVTPILHESAFTGKREYVYRYMAQTAAGIPGASKIYSGVKVEANVRLQFDTASVVVAQFEDLELFTMNEAIRTATPVREQVNSDLMTRFYCPVIYKALEQPFTFNYVKGHVSNLETEEEEPYWSVNIKRGLLSLLEVNLEKRWTTAKIPTDEPAYAAYELTASGVCRTEYTVETNEFNPEVPVETMIVSKTKDFNNCFMRPDWVKNTIRNRPCPGNCEYNETAALTEGSNTRYTLKGNYEQFVILSAVGASHAGLVPFAPHKNHITTVINQTMYLVEATDINPTFDVESLTTTMVPRRLTTFIPQEIIDRPYPFAEQTHGPFPMDEMRYAKKEMIVNVLKTVAQSMDEPEVLKEVAGLPTVAVHLIRLANETVLREIWEEFAMPTLEKETAEEIVLKKVVRECVAAAGTYATGTLILESCIEKKIEPTHCATLISMASIANEPNSTFVEKLLTAVNELDTEDPALTRALWLGVGTIAHKLARIEEEEVEELTVGITLLENMLPHETNEQSRQELTITKEHLLKRRSEVTKMYIDLRSRIEVPIKEQLSKADIEAKIIALKAAANAGLPELVPLCLYVAEDMNMPEYVRQQAVWAMLKVAYTKPEMVIKPLMPILMNTVDETSVRIAAFSVIIAAQPPKVIVEMMARHIAREPDLQVASWMYSVFETMSNSSNPCFRKLARMATTAIHLAPRVAPGIQYSALRSLEYFKETGGFESGIGTYLAIIGSNSSILPKSFNLRMDAHMFGKSASIIEVGGFVEGLGKVVDKMVGPDGILTNRKSILDILSPRMKRNVGAEQILEDIAQTLKIEPRKLPEPMGSIHVSLFGYEINFFNVQEVLTELATAGKISFSFTEGETGLKLPMEYSKLLYIGDTNIILPTEAGMPVSFTFSTTAATKVDGYVKAKVTPSLFESRRQTAPIEAKAEFKIFPSAVLAMTGQTAIHAFGATAGTAFRIVAKVNVPLVGNLTADLPKRKIITAFMPPMQEEPLVEVAAYPFTFQTVAPTNEEHIIEVTEGARVEEGIYSYGENTMGVGFLARAKWTTKRGEIFGHHFLPVTGLSSLNIFVKPTEHTPEAIVFQTQFATGAPVKTSGGSSAPAVSSCDCFMGRATFCMVSCPEEDAIDPEVIESGVSLEDFPNLLEKEITMGELKAKLQSKLGTSMRISPFGHKWGMITTIDASTPRIERKFQLEALWQSVNRDHMHQVVLRVARTPLPTYPEPWELITHGMLQYPNRMVTPKMLLDPKYHTQINHDMKFMTRFMNHRPLLATINQTAITIVKKNLQELAGNPKPQLTLRTLALQIFARANATEVRELLPIWREIITQVEYVEKIEQEAIDPVFIIKHVNTLLAKLSEIEKIQIELIERIKELKEQKPSSILYIPLLQYCMLEHMDNLLTLQKICSRTEKMSIIANFNGATKTEQMISNFYEQMSQNCEELEVIPRPETMIEEEFQKLWPKIQQLSTAQNLALAFVVKAKTMTSFSNTQPINRAVSLAKEVVPMLLKTLKETKLGRTGTLEIVPVLTKISIQHYTLFMILSEVIQTPEITSPKVNTELSHILKKIKTDCIALSFATSHIVKYRYELITLEQILPPADLKVVKEMNVIEFEIELEFFKTKALNFIPMAYEGNYDVPENEFSQIDDVLEFVDTKIEMLEVIVEKIYQTNIEPNIPTYESTAVVVLKLKTLLTNIKAYITQKIIYTSQVARCVDTMKRCQELTVTLELMEMNVTRAFEKIWTTASSPDMSSIPMSESMVEIAIVATHEEQKRVLDELDQIMVAANTAAISIEPHIGSLIQSCTSLQSQLDWIQLWGIPLGSLDTMFARVITVQQELLKKMRELVTKVETHVENPAALDLELENLQGELNRIVKMGAVEMSEVKPMPNIRRMPRMPVNPVVKMVGSYLPLAITGFWNISYGMIGRTPKTIVMNLYASKSYEQLLWEKSQLNPRVREFAVDVAIAREESTELNDIPEHPIYRTLNSLNHRHLVVRFNPEEIPERVKLSLYRAKHMMTSIAFWKTYITAPVTKESGIVHIMDEAKLDHDANDMFIMTPNETVSMYGVNCPYLRAMAVPLTLTRPPFQRELHLEPYLGPFMPPTCKMFDRDVRTFDGVEYTLPHVGPCETVLAMDCSPEKTFAITLKSEVPNYSRKILTIVAEGKVIKIAATVSGPTLTVDGTAVTVTRSKPFILEKTLSYGETAVSAKITLEKMYNIDLPLLGVVVTTNGNFVAVKASPVFKMKTCGLCSNMDGQQRNEFETPEGHVYTNPEPFISTYVIKSTNCPAPHTYPRGEIEPETIEQRSRNMLINEPIAAETKGCEPRKMIVMKNRGKENKVCFSMEPVTVCPLSCKNVEPQKIRVPFKCLDRTEDRAEIKRLRTEVRRGENPEIRSLEKGTVANYKVIEPTSCRRP